MSRDVRNQADWLVGLAICGIRVQQGLAAFPRLTTLSEALVRKLLEMRMAEAFGKG